MKLAKPERALFLAGLFCLTVTGCTSSPPRGEVEGVVRSGGKPLANVLVTFLPDADQGGQGRRSSGKTDAEGRYRLQGEDGKPGAVVGRHRVVIEDLAIYAAPRSSDGTLLAKPPIRFASEMTDPLRTPLRREVKEGPQTIDLDLEVAR